MLKNALLYSATLWLVIFVASQAVAAPLPVDPPAASPNTSNDSKINEVNTITTETTTLLPVNTTTNSTESSTSTVQVTTEAASSTVTESTTAATEAATAKTLQNTNSSTEDATAKTSHDATSTTETASTTVSQSPPTTTTEASTTTVAQTTALTTVEKTSTAVVPTAGRPLKLENMKPREVNQTEVNLIDTKASCSSALQGALNGRGNIYPEKFIFNVSVSTASDAQGYCAQLNETVQHLREACAADTEVAASAKVASLSAMFATLCSQNSTELKVMADKDSHCMEDIKNVTGGCSSSFDKDYSYPTEMLIHEMEANTCKNLTEAKSCITSNLAKRTACSADHQQAVVHLMNSLLGGCSTNDSATTAAAAVDSTTMAPNTTANANTTAAPTVAPTHPSASPSRNAAEGLRLHSIALLLSVALATAILVRWM